MEKSRKNAQILEDLIETVHRLRAPGGCPWDQAQTHQSLRPHFIEETYEVMEVLDQIQSKEDLQKPELREHFKEELGDVLMQVVLHAELTREEGTFDIYDVAQALNDKLIRRHPHVFGEKQVNSASEALESWEEQKSKEKKDKPKKKYLDGIPKGLPALQRGAKIIDKVTRVGFQWDTLQGPLDKLHEEISELKEVLPPANQPVGSLENLNRDAIEHELGDTLFCLANLSHLMGIDPEAALRKTLDRFSRRFHHVEKSLLSQGKSLESTPLEEMDVYWDEAKKLESQKGSTE